jgi:plastocyanin
MKQTATVRKMSHNTGRFTAAAAKPVHITNDKGGVDQNSVTLTSGEEVTWFARGNQKATIRFDSSSPFHDTDFSVPAGGSVSSGAAKSGSDGRYKYTVHGPGGKNDPEVIIQR